jgi:hypothetical protein
MNVAFFVHRFSERGTEVAIYDYARYNEEILNNKSYIICLKQCERTSYLKFLNRFTIMEIDSIISMSTIIHDYKLDFFHVICCGSQEPFFDFENKDLWQKCKTIKHCVFDTTFEEGDFYISISNTLNEKNGTTVPVIPHIVSLETSDLNLRDELCIPKDAFVFGRHGGYKEFNIGFVHDAIISYLYLHNKSQNTYFVFLNTEPFYIHPRIIYLKRNVNTTFKRQFINTCDVMIHARAEGETFGLAIAEFSFCNKPVITCPSGDLEHIQILGNKCIQYNCKEDLENILLNIKPIVKSRENWNAYEYYSPKNIMNLFNDLIFKSREKEKEKEKIIFITAFKDIGRGNWNTLCPRTNEEYFEYFLNLTRNINHFLIVYLDDDIKIELLSKYTFKSNIIFLNLNSVNTFYNKFLSLDEEVMNNPVYKNKIPAHRKGLPEHMYSKYNLINHSKINFIHNAKSLYPNYEFYSWIDFGYVRERETEIRVMVEHLPKKIIYHCLLIPNLHDKISAAEMLKSDIIFITGSSFIVPNELVEQFHKKYENKLIESYDNMVTDDDQSLVLQLYYDNPELFQLKQSDDWFALYRILRQEGHNVLFLITSVVNTLNTCYNNSMDRYKETLNTIKSIKKYLPQATIVVIEASNKVIFNDVIMFYVDDNRVHQNNKSLGESVLLETFLQSSEYKNMNCVDLVFKISGRYTLNNNFCLRKYDFNKFNGRCIKNGQDICYVTCLFSFPYSRTNELCEQLNFVQNNCVHLSDIEHLIFLNTEEHDINEIDVLGITGNIAVNGFKVTY